MLQPFAKPSTMMLNTQITCITKMYVGEDQRLTHLPEPAESSMIAIMAKMMITMMNLMSGTRCNGLR